MTMQHTLREAVLDAWKKGAKERTIPIIGSSMRPLIREGFSIALQPLSGGTRLRIGDIAVFERGSVLIAHRIVGYVHTLEGVRYREKGDNNFYPGTIPADAVIGKVIRIDTGRQIFDLTRWNWIAANRLLGIYWRCLFALLEACQKLRHAILPNRRLHGIGAVYRIIVRSLTKLPTVFMRER